MVCVCVCVRESVVCVCERECGVCVYWLLLGNRAATTCNHRTSKHWPLHVLSGVRQLWVTSN